MRTRRSTPLTFKTILLVAVLIPTNSAFHMQPGMTNMSMISLLYNAITTLFVLTLLSHLTATLVPQIALSRPDLLTIYVAISLSTAIGGHMLIQLLFPIIGYAFVFATPENDWQALFCNYIPPWISVKGKQTLICFSGIQRFTPNNTSRHGQLRCYVWSSFLFALFSAILAINFILRKQWTENEKLSYPLIQLPLAMTSRINRLFYSKVLWLGFGTAAIVDLIKGLNHLFPQFPRTAITRARENNIANLFTSPLGRNQLVAYGNLSDCCRPGVFHAPRFVLFGLRILYTLEVTGSFGKCTWHAP